MTRNIKRLGVVGFAFFFLKGMVWLAACGIAIFGTNTL